MILSHNFAPTVEAVTEQAQKALSFGAPTEIEIELAETIIGRVPSMERVRMVNSGTEATMSAIRLARGFEAGYDREIFRLLPRPLGLPAGQSRQRGVDPWSTEFPGRA